jgi:2-C-methyl-D-erythritol 4-phosphate cytidylyltransferase
LYGRDTLIVIHDGARPLASAHSLNESIELADLHGGAVASVPARDTVKVGMDGFAADTPDRAMLYNAQTPQAFRLDILIKAHETAAAEGFIGSDDASLVERIGGKVYLSAGSNRNIKITFPEDLIIAEALLMEELKS